ncbi:MULTISPECIES: FAD-dependent oxidoreductase [Oenococcus]|uniref:Alkyl hydroperoxide reductase protein F n=1 Tax=Oenococcus kitaharae DSM 17330 TaxID=1045004 RepID=G9WJ92_9LACO|nr:FAD-dependent oxidoreductase [Oenococcus kitaharae]EHN58698.1 Alkyl hydroperoxide reductase protein F [Oenococcus kitaharae DSM 17330]OEY83218.1 thioredoxin reductase [Oenococcus kitaharae]OEY84260.1 thioredoxin reductase [Oenococcus kitaharae]OEY85898.1 thioredoxin reductase [Oenococcus kitaharae]
MNPKHIYDTIIIGAGPAGLTAGIYAGRAALDTMIIERDQVGGQVTTTSTVWNYPAVADIDGSKLVNLMQKQIDEFRVPIVQDDIQSMDLNQEVKVLHGQQDYFARSVIFATGANPKKAGFEGEDKYRGHGVAYCSTCDGELFSGLQIFVVGGGYSAAEEADYLSRFGRHVTILVRGSQFTCASLTAQRAIDNPKIDIQYNTVLKKVSGDTFLKEAELFNRKTGQSTTYHLTDGDETFGVFVFVGTKANSEQIKDVLETDADGYVLTDARLQTNLPGVFAAGDLLAKPLRQIVTAAADGALAATSAENYVIEQKRQLGIPIKAAKKQRPVSSITQQTTLDSEEEKTPLAPAHAGTWFPDEIKAQLKALFVRLNQAVTLLVLTDDSAKSRQLLSFTKELSALDPAHLSVQQETSTATADKRLPALILLDNKKQDSGIRFSGIPTGHELNSIVLAIYNLAGPGQSIDTKLVDQIKALPAMHLQIGVSLTCHFCPDVVAASQRIAALNPKITAEMIDLQLFPDFRKSKKIMSVPAFMINEGDVTFGSQTLNQIIDLCQQQA